MSGQRNLRTLHVLPTSATPEFIFKPEGNLKIQGRWMRFFDQDYSMNIIKWLDSYSHHPAEITSIDINLEYFNNFCSPILLSFLRKSNNVILKNKKVVINWYYEEGDEYILEKGTYFSSNLGVKFNFVEIPVYSEA